VDVPFVNCILEYLASISSNPIPCPSCSEPLTVDVDADNNEEDDNDNGEDGDEDNINEVNPELSERISREKKKGRPTSGSGAIMNYRNLGYNNSRKFTLGNGQAISFDSKSILNRIDLDNFQSSTKLEALIQELHKMNQRDPSAKAIVFSQFVNMLDLCYYRIKLEGINVVQLRGSMSVSKRDEALDQFRADPFTKVLLISLKAGGVALNLTVANYIFLMDPWWNPAAEMQAIDRTHRIGQTKPIFATRLIIENSIEERILKLQEKKQLVFDGTVGGDAGSLMRLTVQDLQFLFTNT